MQLAFLISSIREKEPVDPGHAHVEHPKHPASVELGGLGRLLRHRDVGRPACAHAHQPLPRNGGGLIFHNPGYRVVGHFGHCRPHRLVLLFGGPGAHHVDAPLPEGLIDLHKMLRLLALAEDHLAEAPALSPVEIDLGAADVGILLAAQHDLGLLKGKLPPLYLFQYLPDLHICSNLNIHAAGPEALQIQRDIGKAQLLKAFYNPVAVFGEKGKLPLLHLDPGHPPVKPEPHGAKAQAF